jgi:toxin ParE1/3/4
VKVRYTNPAAADLADVLDYLVAKSPLGSRCVQKRLRAIERLSTQFPMTGEATRLPWLRGLRLSLIPMWFFMR